MGGRRRHQGQRKALKREKEEEDLDRFAGSSEEEEEDESLGSSSGGDDDDDREHESDAEQVSPTKKQHSNDQHVANNPLDEHQDEEASVPENDDVSPLLEADDDDVVVASGMASAMSKILGTTIKRGTPSVVLSKTTTPLQRMAMKEREQDRELREKRKANRERNLTALHVPLSVATSRVSSPNINSGGQAVALELEQERAHRRVATRGVVALFNAIAQHQKKSEAPTSSTTTKDESKQDVKKLSKHGFLDMIKSAAAAKSKASKNEDHSMEQSSADKTSAQARPASSKSKWGALQEDYMLNSKLKDWDKESSSDEEEENAANNDWASDDEDAASGNEKPSKKRRVTTAH